MFSTKQLDSFKKRTTPFYFYDLNLFRKTLEQIKVHGVSKGYHIHYALKANSHPQILAEIVKAGLSADCVSGGEVERATECGFSPNKIAFAGVGKRDIEIEIGLKNNILCFNVESVQELQVIDQLASQNNQTARVALRINPNVDANTHKYITTGLKENKFGINEKDLPDIFKLLPTLNNIELVGIHFHIGSQIEKLEPFKKLCLRANELNDIFENDAQWQRNVFPTKFNHTARNVIRTMCLINI